MLEGTISKGLLQSGVLGEVCVLEGVGRGEVFHEVRGEFLFCLRSFGAGFVMPKSSQNKILANFFADTGENCGEHLAKKLRRFSAFGFQQDWPQETSRKFLGKSFHEP